MAAWYTPGVRGASHSHAKRERSASAPYLSVSPPGLYTVMSIPLPCERPGTIPVTTAVSPGASSLLLTDIDASPTMSSESTTSNAVNARCRLFA